ncbi:MAG TPA: ArgE/DapE family deacylase [Candidatus Stackebrandtia faecavium]|nr:ArgE/DapE family deacylase [Candidatus Stackebrandtia faecavium]
MDWQQRTLSCIATESETAVALLRQLVEIPSEGGAPDEVRVQQYLARWCRDQGWDVDHWRLPLTDLAASPEFPGAEVDRNEAWGVVGRRRGAGGGPSLMFNGHTDVVPAGSPAQWTVTQPYVPAVRDGRLYGRGACDMKAGLVAALFAVRALDRAEVPLAGDVLIAGVIGEEDGGLGTYGLLERGWSADACIIPEPTGLAIVPANGGALTFRLTVFGKAAHASHRTSGVSAVERFWPIFSALRVLEQERNAQVDPLMRRWELAYPIEIGTVTAGDWVSSVPDTLVAQGRFGIALGESIAEAKDRFEAAIARACSKDSWLAENPVTVEWWGGQFASGRLPAQRGMVADRLTEAHRRVTGETPQTWGAPYGSDLRLMTGIGDIPTVQYGPGDVAQAHAADEWVSLAELNRATQALALAAIDFCGFAEGSDDTLR